MIPEKIDKKTLMELYEGHLLAKFDEYLVPEFKRQASKRRAVAREVSELRTNIAAFNKELIDTIQTQQDTIQELKERIEALERPLWRRVFDWLFYPQRSQVLCSVQS